MSFPSSLKLALAREAEGIPRASLREAAERLSLRYRSAKDGAPVALKNDAEVLAYAISRMPATFAAFDKVLHLTREICADFTPETHLDLGCGTGAALYSARGHWPQLRQRGEDQHKAMLALARRLEPLIEWQEAGFTQASAGTHDLVTACYALGETSRSKAEALADVLWARAGQMIVIVEPGSPRGYETILALRAAFLRLGGIILAPCPHHEACPMQEGWCHNGVRLERSKLHRALKQADAPFEDEQFCYLVVGKTDLRTRHPQGRILHKPIDNKTGLTFASCLADGTMADVVVPRRDKEFHRIARRLERGDALFEFEE